LEFFADFCLRAAYYLGLPAFGPVPLPRIVERWTVPKGSFIHKKSQENFERKTLRRLIQIKDGAPETVEVWLAFVKKYAYYGIGMKANIWEFEKVGTCIIHVFFSLVVRDCSIGMMELIFSRRG
jgi:ribosomal protein S10